MPLETGLCDEPNLNFEDRKDYYFLEDFLLESPWVLVAAILTLPCFIAGGLRLGLFSCFVIYFWGAVGMWEASLQTLALMGLSVFLCVFFGVLLGIACSQSDRFENFMKPVELFGIDISKWPSSVMVSSYLPHADDK